MKRITAILFILLSIFIFGEESSTGDKLMLKEIEIVNSVHVPNEVIESLIVSKKGEEYSAGNMIKDYINIKGLKYIEEANIYPDIFDKGVKLTIEIKEKSNAYTLLKEDGIVPQSEREKIDKSLIVKSIEVYGNMFIKKEAILKEIPLKVGGYLSKEKTLEGKDNILKLGYFRDVNTEILKYGTGIYVKYTVIENPVITGVVIQGNTILKTEELVKLMETKAGEVYNINVLKKDNDKLLEAYRNKGYAMANISSVNMSDDLKIVIKISEGIVRNVIFKKVMKNEDGKSETVDLTDDKLKTKGFVLTREVEIEKGKVFELAPFQNTMKNIFRLGYFKDIKPEFEKIPGDEDGLNVVFYLDESKTGAFMGSVSYGSEAGLVGSLGIQDNNFLGNSQSIGINFTGSKDKRTYDLSFSDPWIKGTDKISFSTSLYKTDEKLTDEVLGTYTTADNRKRITNGFTLTTGKELFKNIRGKIGYKIEDVKTTWDEITTSPTALTVNKKDHYVVQSITPAITYDTRNNYLNATDGNYARLSLELGKYNIEKKGYGIAELEYRRYNKLFFDKNILAVRTLGGWASRNVKEGERFSLGGGNTIRGFDPESFTGFYEWYANIEDRISVEDKFQLVLFFDMGMAWNDISDKKRVSKGYGIGLRIDTPLGPLRLDYGWPLGEENNKNGKFYFNIGQMF